LPSLPYAKRYLAYHGDASKIFLSSLLLLLLLLFLCSYCLPKFCATFFLFPSLLSFHNDKNIAMYHIVVVDDLNQCRSFVSKKKNEQSRSPADK
jgi:hypothetical protein